MPPFRISSEFKPAGDQPQAIEELCAAVGGGQEYVTLLGATGTGKTFTVAHVVEQLQRPTLVIAPNKSLGAQLANEFREVFPDNAVEYFVSYYDYYQPEAYIASTDTYIEKDSSVNEEIERLRHAATAALLSRGATCSSSPRCPASTAWVRPRSTWGRSSGRTRARRSRSSSRCSGWWTSSTSATTSAARAGRSACRATPWRCSLPTNRSASASNGGATPSRRSCGSTRSRESCWTSSPRPRSSPPRTTSPPRSA